MLGLCIIATNWQNKSTLLKIEAILKISKIKVLTKGKKMSYRKLYGSCLFFKEFTIYNKLEYKTLIYKEKIEINL